MRKIALFILLFACATACEGMFTPDPSLLDKAMDRTWVYQSGEVTGVLDKDGPGSTMRILGNGNYYENGRYGNWAVSIKRMNTILVREFDDVDYTVSLSFKSVDDSLMMIGVDGHDIIYKEI